MRIKRFTLGPIQSNCYVVYKNNKALVIDPGYEQTAVSLFLVKTSLDVSIIYITHGHYDHIGGVNQLKKQYPNAVVYAPADDIVLLDPSYGIQPIKEKINVDFYLNKDKDHTLVFEDMAFDILYTPGHSFGSTALYNNKHLFSGDTLFKGSIGRTDLYLSSYDEIVDSIKNKLYLLPDETIVYPGHGFTTTVEIEKRTNPFVRG